ncbi:MAG: hypothetical protein ACPGYL_00840 [Rhodospirillaceae bacterium]
MSKGYPLSGGSSLRVGAPETGAGQTARPAGQTKGALSDIRAITRRWEKDADRTTGLPLKAEPS